MRVLEVKALVSGYGDLDILKGVSMSLDKGEVVAVIGPNGAGKSTLLKTLFGLLTPREGRVIFKGMDITGLRPDKIVRLGIGYVPQRKNIFPSLTVLENLEMGAFIEDDTAKVREALKRVYKLLPILRERDQSRASTLSGGEQQMVAIGKALMLNPEVLLLDEPSAGLAPMFVDAIFDKIRRISDRDTAIAVVEQNARRALGIADRGYVLDMGRNRFEGSGRELLNNEKVKRLYLGG